jgi:predicted transcriptional regulator
MSRKGIMKKTVLLSIKKEWWDKIKSGEKTYEIRKTKPTNIDYPFRVICYVTGGTGIVGEFYCDGTLKTNLYMPLLKKSCLSSQEMNDYAKGSNIVGWHIKEGTVSSYGTPIPLHFFDIKRPPQSWQYFDLTK